MYVKNRLHKGEATHQNATVFGCALILALLAYGIARCFWPVYSDGDNYHISMVLSGSFGTNPFCQFINPILSGLSYVLAQLFGEADGFLLICCCAMFVSLWLLFAGILGSGHSGLEKCILLLCTMLLWFWSRPVSNNFTVQASFLAISGLVIIRTHCHRRPLSAVGAVITVLGFMVRLEGAFLVLPFWGLVVLADAMEMGGLRQLPKVLRPYVPVFVGIFAAVAVQKVFFSIEPMKSGMAFSDLRGNTLDYPVTPYHFLTNGKTEITEQDYYLPRYWVFLYDDAEMLRQFEITTRIGNYNLFDLRSGGVNNIVEEGVYLLTTYKKKLILPAMAAALTMLAQISRREKWYAYAQTILSWLGALVIMLYFMSVGRLPLRVIMAILLPCMTVNVLAAAKRNDSTEAQKTSVKEAVSVWLPAVFLAAGIAFTLYAVHTHRRYLIPGFFLAAVFMVFLPVVFRKKDFLWAVRSVNCIVLCALVGCAAFTLRTESVSKPQSILHARSAEFAQGAQMGDTVYYTAYLQLPAEEAYINAGKLRPREHTSRFIHLGSWLHGQPYFHAFLQENGLTYPANDLLYRPDTYLLAAPDITDVIVMSLQEHYGASVHAVPAGEYDGLPVWQILPE